MRGSKLRLRGSRSRGRSVLAVIGSCLGVYAVFAVGFHWFVETTVKSQGVAPYEPSLATVVQSSGASFVTPARPNQPSRVTPKPLASTIAATAPKSAEPARSEPPRVVPPMAVTTAAPKAAEIARSEASPRIAPPMTVTATAPQSTETARAEAPAHVAPAMAVTTGTSHEASTAAAIAAPESDGTAAAEPKKPAKKVARKPRHERPSRDFWNPMNYFAWGPGNGARRSF